MHSEGTLCSNVNDLAVNWKIVIAADSNLVGNPVAQRFSGTTQNIL
jgi:hypothetical protein